MADTRTKTDDIDPKFKGYWSNGRYTRTNRARRFRGFLGRTINVDPFGWGVLEFGYYDEKGEFVECGPHEFPDARIGEKPIHLGYFLDTGDDRIQLRIKQTYDHEGSFFHMGGAI